MIYHIAGKFGEVFNLAIWRSRRKLPNLIPPILNRPAGTSTSRNIPVHSSEKAMSGILLSLSLREGNSCR